MFTVRKSAVAILFLIFVCLVATSSAFGSAANIYITQNGSPSGNCTTNVQTPAFFNNAANWGSGASQIGPGTTVLLCGTFTSSAQGGNVLTMQGSGSPNNYITITFDTNAQMNSSGWWGSYPSCCGQGAITVSGFNYVIIDGQNTGIIQNMLAGTSSASCPAGACTQQPGSNGSLGVALKGDHLIVRNLTIQNIYINDGANSGATDAAGQWTGDILVDNGSTNVHLYNNILNNARAAIWSETSDTHGPNSCPLNGASDNDTGICYYNNTLTDHAWQMAINGSGTANVYNNDIGTNANWAYPSNTYHTDGIITFGDPSNAIITDYIFNNYFHGDLGLGSPTAEIYCTYGMSGSGSICYIFNNVIVGTGTSATNAVGIWVGASVPGTNPIGPIYMFNNTIVGFNASILPYGAVQTGLTIENNLASTDSSGYFFEEDLLTPGSVIVACDHHNWYGGRGAPFTGAGSYYTFAQWQAAGFDIDGSNGNPNLNGNYTLQAGSSAIGLGANLTSLGITALNYDKPVNVGAGYVGAPNNPRAASGTCKPGVTGCWDAGAYQYASGSGPNPPTKLTAKVN
jgi:hypothetical protein